MDEHSCLSNDVDCYCVAKTRIGAHATVSQYSYLCSAGHDYRNPTMPVVAAPISIEAEAWVGADAFVGPGVTIGAGAVVGARSAVFKDVEPWAVVVGSPPRKIGSREPFVRPLPTEPGALSRHDLQDPMVPIDSICGRDEDVQC